MPERFESKVYPPEETKLMKDAFRAAWQKVEIIDQDEDLTRQMLATAIIDQVKAGVQNRDEIVAAAIAMLAAASKRAR